MPRRDEVGGIGAGTGSAGRGGSGAGAGSAGHGGSRAGTSGAGGDAPGSNRGRRGFLTAALRVARADLLARRGQTALTALAIFAASAALVVTLALRAGIDDPFADAQRATRGADVGFTRGELTPAQIAALTNRPDVKASDTRPV